MKSFLWEIYKPSSKSWGIRHSKAFRSEQFSDLGVPNDIFVMDKSFLSPQPLSFC